MALDSHFADFLEMLNAHKGPSTFEGTPAEIRARLAAALGAHLDPATYPKVRSVEERLVPGTELRVQVIRPIGGAEARPIVAYLHPGGFAMGSIELFEDVARRLSADADVVVVSLDYPLAPEHTPQQAVDAVVTTVTWIADAAGELGGRPDQIGIVGESSGGNLAAAAAIPLRDQGFDLRYQVLISPYTDLARQFPSESTFAAGHFLTARDLADIRRLRLTDPSEAHRFPASPAHADDLQGVAPALVAVAGCDPLRDDGVVYAARLLQAGVPTTLRVYHGLIHPFFGMPAVSPTADAAVTDICADLSDALRSGSRS